jgi:hypothetical protein
MIVFLLINIVFLKYLKKIEFLNVYLKRSKLYCIINIIYVQKKITN